MNDSFPAANSKSTFGARAALLGAVFLSVLTAMGLAAPLGGGAFGVAAAAAADQVPGGVLGADSDADRWRRVRGGESFTLSGPGAGTFVMVQSEGARWRALRNGPVSVYGGWLLALAGAGVIGFFLLRGRVRLPHRSGRTIARFTHAERAAHWFVAATFILLAVSGLILLYGRYILQPLIGLGPFAVVASAALQGHNLFGPLFAVGVVAMVLLYLKDNVPRAADIGWLLRGGMFFRGHVSCGKFNLGEKAWFWIFALGGIVIAASGLLMDFPGLAQSVQQLQIANILHAVAALGVIAASLGHMYLGTVGVEGALEGMTTGRVDEAWGLEHHDLWAKDVVAAEREKSAGAAGAGERP